MRTGAPSRAALSAMRAAPVFSSASSGSEWLLPSGKMVMARPCTSAPFAASSVPSLRPICVGSSCLRYTGSAFKPFNSQPMTGSLNSGALAMNVTWRRVRMNTNAGSMSPFGWLPTKSTGPEGASPGAFTFTR
ncbi:hypothetical protein COEX109129_18640 [Corallococcus exiguus]